MQLVLTLPGLLASPDAETAPLQSPSLARLLAASDPPSVAGDDLAEALARCYGIARQSDWPMAPIRLAHLGVDPGASSWLVADPVTLAVGRHDVRLEGLIRDFTRDEADSVLATLNAHFVEDGLEFVAPRPDTIFVRARTAPRLVTHPAPTATCRPLSTLLPEGPDGGLWRRWQSEIQMLLHEHPVNVAREGRGRPSANSLWFSGGGTLPARGEPSRRIRTYANDEITSALAAHAASPAKPLPADLDAALSDAADADVIVVSLASPLDSMMMEQSWARAARAALTSGMIESVTLLADGEGRAVAWRALRPSLWQRIRGRFATHDLAALLAAAAGSE